MGSHRRTAAYSVAVGWLLATGGCFLAVDFGDESLRPSDASASGGAAASGGAVASGGVGASSAGGGGSSSSSTGGSGGVCDAASDYFAAVISDNPISFWELEDPQTDPGYITNAITAGMGGTFNKFGALFQQPGIVKYGILFNDQELVTVPDPSFNFASGQAFSLEAWVLPTDLTAHRFIFSRQNLNGMRQGYALAYDGTAFQFERWSTGSLYVVPSVSAPKLNQWHHVVATFDGTYMIIYLNGVSDTNGVPPEVTDANVDFVIGQINGGSGGVIGTLDELAVYDTALSQDRVTAHCKAACFAGCAP